MAQPTTACAASPPVAAPRGWVGSGWGWRRGSEGQQDLHTGLDIGAPEGWPVLAVLPGHVRAMYPSGEMRGYGNTVILEHDVPGGAARFTMYAHLASFAPGLRPGQPVAAGQLIGAVGRTAGTREDPGRVFVESRRHLHMEALTRWPPSARDVDRVNVTEWLRPLGIIAQPRSRLRVEPGSYASCAAQRMEAANASPAPGAPQGIPAAHVAAAAGGGLALVAILWALAQSKR